MCWQVSPLKWPSERNRAVLDRALSGAITDGAILEAARAIDGGFQGTLARSAHTISPSQLASIICMLQSTELPGSFCCCH